MFPHRRWVLRLAICAALLATSFGLEFSSFRVKADPVLFATKTFDPFEKAVSDRLSFDTTTKLIAVGASSNPQAGSSVSIDGNYIVFGAAQDTATNSSGSAFIYEKRAGVWTFAARLEAPFPNSNMQFGTDVLVSGDTVFISAPYAAVEGINQGAVFVFRRIDGVWSFVQRINTTGNPNVRVFGRSMATDGNRLAVKGETLFPEVHSVYIFEFEDSAWRQKDQIFSPIGSGSFSFGNRMSINGNRIAIGATTARNGNGVNTGAVYIFTRSGTTWVHTATILGSDSLENDRFGFDLSLRDDGIVIGADKAVVDGVIRGAAYYYHRSGDSWVNEQKLTSVGIGGIGDFGGSVKLKGDRIIIGERLSDILQNESQGAAYVFARNAGQWTFQGKLVAPDGQLADNLGYDVDLYGNEYIAGATKAPNGSFDNQGAVYVFADSIVPPDLMSDSDTGVSSSDNITSLRNLNFDVRGVTPGATVDLFRDGNVIGSVVAQSNSVVVNDALLPTDGTFAYQSRQTVNGQTGSLSATLIVTVDNTRPRVQVEQSADTPDPSRGPTFDFQISVDEQVIGLDVSDVSLAGSTANVSSASLLLNPTTRKLTIDNVTSNGGFIRPFVVAGAVSDLAGNLSDQSFSSDNTVTVDTVAPTLVIDQHPSQADPTNQVPIRFRVVASEPVVVTRIDTFGSTTNIGLYDWVQVGNGSEFEIHVTRAESNGQFLRLSIPQFGARDSVGNQNEGPSSSTDNTVTIDNVGPRPTLNQAQGQFDPTWIFPANFSVQFDEPVATFNASSVSLAGSTMSTAQASIAISGQGTVFNIAVTPANLLPGSIMASIPANVIFDQLGNGNRPSVSSDNVVSYYPIGDPGFNFTNTMGANPAWSSTSTFFGTSLCVSSLCGNGNGTAGPRSGSGWVWFDGTGSTNAESGTVSQSFVVPEADSVVLKYHLRRGSVVAPANSVFQVIVDGQILQVVGESEVPDAVYVERTVDLSAYADGNSHNLTFSYFRPAGAPSDNFVLDELSLIVEGGSNGLRTVFDLDGDQKTDLSIFRPNGISSEWWWLKSSGGNAAVVFGANTDRIVPADYTGDGKTDVAFWRPSTGFWYVLRSEDLTFYGFPFGASGDVPVPGDYDADGKADVGVFRPTDNTWYIQRSGDNGTTIQQFGVNGDVPVNADYDGDGKADIAIYRPSLGQWWLMRSSAGTVAYQFGSPTDKTVVGDYTGDGKADVAFWRPATGEWYVLRSEDTSFFAFPFGVSTDTPVPGDYDGDGKQDAGVFRSSNSTWYINRTTAGTLIQQFGTTGDVPLPNAYVR